MNEIKIEVGDGLSNIDAVYSVLSVLATNDKSGEIKVFRAIDGMLITIKVQDLNPSENTHDKQFKVSLADE